MDINNNLLATLIHISDLHFCEIFTNEETMFKDLLQKIPFLKGSFAHSYQAARALSNRINQILKNRQKYNIPTGVVFTGDLTRGGKIEEMKVGFKFLRETHSVGAGNSVGLGLGNDIRKIELNSPPRLFLVHGNHDIWQRNDPRALDFYTKRFPVPYPAVWELKTQGRPIHLYGLNSMYTTTPRQMVARGGIAPEELKYFEEVDHPESWKKAIHIVFLHHPLINPDVNRWDITMKLDGCEDIAKLLKKFGADLVLSGHYHYEYHANANSNLPNHAIAGSATQLFDQDRNFLLFDIYDEIVKMIVFQYDNKERQFVCNNEKYHIFNIRKYVASNNSCKAYNTDENGDILDKNGIPLFTG